MIKKVIDIVQSNGDVSSENINTARRILEAFCFFNYKEGINEFSRDKEVLSTISEENLKNYLETQLYRVILNNESHYEEYIKALPQEMGYDRFSNEEKRQVIKDVCILIFSLNPIHLKKILYEKDSDRFSIVEQWTNELIKELNS